MEEIKTLTLRKLQEHSQMINFLKNRFGCSASQALIIAGNKYIQVDKELMELKQELLELKREHSTLKRNVTSFCDALESLKTV